MSRGKSAAIALEPARPRHGTIKGLTTRKAVVSECRLLLLVAGCWSRLLIEWNALSNGSLQPKSRHPAPRLWATTKSSFLINSNFWFYSITTDVSVEFDSTSDTELDVVLKLFFERLKRSLQLPFLSKSWKLPNIQTEPRLWCHSRH